MFGYLKKRLEDYHSKKRAVYDDQYYQEQYLGRFNTIYGFTIKPYHRYLGFCLANLAKLKKKDKILEIGCGIGTLTGELKKLGYKVVGIDVNEAAIKNSISRDHCQLVKDTKELDWSDNFFDLVVSKEVLEHIPEIEIDDCIKEWDRVSKGKQIHIISVEERGVASTKNPSHLIVKPEKWWIDKFKKHGYSAKKQPWWAFYVLSQKGFFIFTKINE